AMRRGLGPGRKRERGVPSRSAPSGRAVVDEGIFFLLVLAPAPCMDRAAGAMVCGGTGLSGRVSTACGARARGVCCGLSGGISLLVGEVLDLATHPEHECAGEEQREEIGRAHV